jgi:hypothetical protein
MNIQKQKQSSGVIQDIVDKTNEDMLRKIK